MAVEAVAPLPVMARLLGARELDGIVWLRAEFARGPDGRVLVTGRDESGRDIMALDRYVRLVRVRVETAEL